MSGGHLSKEFFDLVKSIGESRSKQEEDKIISHEVRTLKTKMAEKDVPNKKMKEFLIRMIYVEMLGHDASFGHINAVKMVSSPKLLEKRVGYMACSLCLHANHSFMLLLINTMQNDLKSDNFLEVSMALTVVCKLVNAETIPALLPLVARLLEHKQANIRKKAIVALHRFNQIDSQTIVPLLDKVRKILCDKDPSVMGASLCLFHDLCVSNPLQYKDLVPSFVSILKQVTEHRLPRDYDYHRMPAPWIQLKLLQILAVLGANDKQTSEGMYEILHEVMKRADIGINVGYAIVYECVRTITTIYPDNALIEDASLSISRFITSDNHNLKYLGVNSLAAIVQINPKYAAEHQLTVIDCLEDPDETLKRKTLDLLYSMTNEHNVVVIVEKLTNFLRSTVDVYLRTELVSRINQLAEKYAPNNSWYIQTMNNIFELGGELVRPEVAHSLMRLIAESVNHEGQQQDLRVYAVETYLQLLNKRILPDILIQVISWVLGEYGHLSNNISRQELITRLCQVMERHHDQPATRSWLLLAIMKLCAHLPVTTRPASNSLTSAPLGIPTTTVSTVSVLELPKEVTEMLTRYQNSLFVDLQQRAHEFAELVKAPQTMAAVLPHDSMAETFNADVKLSFLNDYVNSALKAGAASYQPKEVREEQEAKKEQEASIEKAKEDKLKIEPYASPQSQFVSTLPSTTPVVPTTITASNPTVTPPVDTPLRLLVSSTSKKWTQDGYVDEKTVKSASPSVASPSSASSSASSTYSAPTLPYADPSKTAPSVSSDKTSKRSEKTDTKELSEKEKLAQSLFSGIIDTSTTAAPAVSRAATLKRGTTSSSISSTSSSTPHASSSSTTATIIPTVVATTASTPATTSTTNTATQNKDYDFLSNIFTPAVTQASQPVPLAFSTPVVPTIPVNTPSAPEAKTNPLSLDNLFDPISRPQTTTTQSDFLINPNVTNPPVPNDPFSSLVASTGSSSLDPKTVLQTRTYGSLTMSVQMQSRLSGLKKSHTNDQILLSNNVFQVAYFKSYASDRTIIALFISNLTGQPLLNVAVQLDMPLGLSVSYEGDPNPFVKNNTLVVQQLMPYTTSTQLISISIRDASSILPKLPLSIAATVSYGNATALARFNLSVELFDLLRPFQITTDRFGGYWKSFAQEKKFTVSPTSCTVSNEFMNRMKEQVGIYPVQTIGQENIVAGKIVSTAQELICLVHGKIKPGPSLDVLIRTQNQDFSSQLAVLALRILQ